MESPTKSQKPYLFPILRTLTLDEAVTYIKTIDPKKGTLVFLDEHGKPTHINFGPLGRAEMVYTLESVKHSELLLDFAEGDEENEN